MRLKNPMFIQIMRDDEWRGMNEIPLDLEIGFVPVKRWTVSWPTPVLEHSANVQPIANTSSNKSKLKCGCIFEPDAQTWQRISAV
jgi:hypothetical protein